MIKTHEDDINQDIATDIIHLMNTIGNLHIHVSGEGKVDFVGGAGDSSGWCGMVSTIISGDAGCMKPYDNNPKCALDAAIKFLRYLEPVPHLNSSINDKHVPTLKAWLDQVSIIETKLKALKETDYSVKYVYEIKLEEEGEPVIVITLKPLSNVFVVGEFQATRKFDYIGEIQDYDQPMSNAVVITCEDKDFTIQFENLIYYRNRKHRWPRKKDYLLKDPDSDKYVVLPQEDYSIH